MKTSEDDALTELPIGNDIDSSKPSCPANQYHLISQSQKDAPLSVPSADQIEKEVTNLMQKNAAALSRYAASFSWDKAIAQDGIQETFLRYFVARVHGQQMNNPRAWLFRVLRNYLLDCNRKSGSVSTVDLKEAVQIADLRQDVEAGYQQNEAFHCALSSLSPRERECMQLRIEGFGYDEIAQILKIRPGTVGALLARGLKKIRDAGFCSRRQRCPNHSSGK